MSRAAFGGPAIGRRWFLVSCLVLGLVAAPTAIAAEAGEAMLTDGERQSETLTLQELERRALADSPVLLAARAAVRAAEGRRLQAGLYPNPSVGYFGEEIALEAPGETSEHMFVIEQRIILGGKLRRQREVFARQVDAAEAFSRAQEQRLLTSIRTLYWRALADARRVELQQRLAVLSDEAVDVTRQLVNVGQADLPDLLAAELEAQRTHLELAAAGDERARTWRQLGALVGDPELEPTALAGDLEGPVPDLEWEPTLAALLADHPEVAVARARVRRAQAAVDRARVEPIPDLLLTGGFGYNFERFRDGAIGPEAFIEAMFEVPLFDRNQGAVAAAVAEVEAAEQEVRRLERSLQQRLAAVFADYRTARRRVERYRDEMIPRARDAYEQYLARFREMRAAYPQVLIAQRTLIQSQVGYVEALGALRGAVATIRGQLLLDALGTATPVAE